MKGIILAGGLGKRLRPLTHAGPKQLIPIANKPVIHYAIEDLVASGVIEIGIIVGYSAERINAIKDACGDGSKWNAKITYIEQDAPRGLAHAVWTARDFLGQDSFVMYLGDNIISGGIGKFVKEFFASDADASLLLAKSRTPERFGVAEIKDNNIVSVEEKPVKPKSDTVIVGVYIFRPSIMRQIDVLSPSARNELEITHAIQGLLSSGRKVLHHTISGWWDDAGTGEDVLHANEMILSALKPYNAGTVEEGASIHGAVEIGKGTVVRKGAKIIGPVKIGDNCTIANASIGPYTSIGDLSEIISGTVESSILMSGCFIDIGAKKISGSLLGKNSKIRNGDTMRLMIGEDSDISV
ncbi:MAG: glucose-1-phosphate thymidylyltransferase [Candidatus Aenigmarchaeota archaeon]|nr:glucose-1-phosphate thymidylyltransferase [Candidatus Aenigmarchaeota archaeon]